MTTAWGQDTDVESDVFVDPHEPPGRLTISINRASDPADLAALVTALGGLYDLLLARQIASSSGPENLLAIIASNLRDLAPLARLEIASLRFASPGEISLRGSGEVIGELRKTIGELATIDQRRKQNKLEQKRLEQELAKRQAKLEHEQQLNQVELARRKQELEFDLIERRPQLIRTDIELGREYMAMVEQAVTTTYGSDWRAIDDARDMFMRMMSGGNQLLQLMNNGVIGSPQGALPEAA